MKQTADPKVFRVVFSVRGDLYTGQRRDVSLWVIARSVEHAIRRARQHARRTFDDKRATVTKANLIGTIDVA